MKKKLLAVILGLTMVSGALAGCGGSSAQNSAPASTEKPAEETADQGTEEGSVEETPEEVEETAAEKAIRERKESGNIPTIVVSFFNWAGPPEGADRVAAAMSEYTEEKLGVKVELMIADFASHAQTLNLMLASGEQVDLFNAITIGYKAGVNNGYMLDLEQDDLLATYGADIASVIEQKYIEACRMNGVLYGLPENRDMAAGKGGVAVEKECLDTAGVDYMSMYANPGDEIIYLTGDEMTEIFKKLHEAYPDRVTTFFNASASSSSCGDIDALGGDFFGVLAEDGSLTVVDPFGTDTYMDFVRRMREWNQLGFFSKDALTETMSATEQVKSGATISYMTGTKPGIAPQESQLCGKEMIVFQFGKNLMSSSSPSSMPWCINQNCADPVAAMQLLNALYTDPVLSNLICWGEEGVDYQLTEDGHATFAEGMDPANPQYFNNVNWQLPNQFIAHIWEGNDLDIWEKTEEFNNTAEASKALGFTFDNSEVAVEYTALINVMAEYIQSIEKGFVDPEVAVPEMRQALVAAGLEKYMAAKQEALDTWAAENGVQ